jgi:hypothetical protein
MAQTHSIRFVLCTILIAFVTFAVVNAEWLVIYRDENFYKMNPETGALTSFQRNSSLSMVDYGTNTLDVNHKRFYWTNVEGDRWYGYFTYIAGHDFVTDKNLVSPGYNVSKVQLSHLFYDNKEDILYTIHRFSHEISVVDVEVENGKLALGKTIGKLHADGYELSLKIVQYDYRYSVLYVNALTSSEYTSVLLGFDLNTGKVLNTLKIPEVRNIEIIQTYLDYDKDLLVVFDLNNVYNMTLVTYTINLKTGEISVPYTAWDTKIENLETSDPLTAFDITTGKGVFIFDALKPKLHCRVIYFDVYNKKRLSDSTIPWADLKAIISTPFSL